MSTNKETSRDQLEVRGFAVGGHVVLRPVLEEDLAALAPLLAGNPGETDRLPWTQQRLKKKFEDEKEPGLWGKNTRYLAAVRREGGEVVGYVKEHRDENPGVFWAWIHVADGAGDRDVLGPDMISAYLAYKQRWHDPFRVSFDILGCEADKAGWLEACGFPLELTRRRMVLWLGQPQDLCTYTWYSDRLKAELAKREE